MKINPGTVILCKNKEELLELFHLVEIPNSKVCLSTIKDIRTEGQDIGVCFTENNIVAQIFCLPACLEKINKIPMLFSIGEGKANIVSFKDLKEKFWKERKAEQKEKKQPPKVSVELWDIVQLLSQYDVDTRKEIFKADEAEYIGWIMNNYELQEIIEKIEKWEAKTAEVGDIVLIESLGKIGIVLEVFDKEVRVLYKNKENMFTCKNIMKKECLYSGETVDMEDLLTLFCSEN